MKKKRILHQNRPRHQWIGGDVVQMDNTMVELGKMGLDISFSDKPLFQPALLLQDYDITHLWNFSMPWTKFQLWSAKRHGLKVVCSMIYHETDAFIPYDQQQVMLDNLDAAIFLSEGEIERVRRHLNIRDEIIHIIPNGIDPIWFKDTKEKNKYGDYVLSVGRIETPKGQLAVSKACKELGIKYVCAGEIVEDAIAKEIKKNGGILLGSCSKEELKPLYKHCKAFVLASKHEIFPLTVMEAGAQKANIVLTETSEWKPEEVELCEFDNVKSIKKAIQTQIAKKKTDTFKKKLEEMTWTNVAKEVAKIYKKL